MKIEIRRRWKKDSYTIGELYVNGVFRCNTLEPQDRGFKSSMSSMSIHEAKVPGKTAIPTGTYVCHMHWMVKRKKMRPQLMDVPGFFGIFIHEGNTVGDTRGCILLGENTSKGFLSSSKKHVIALSEAITDCDDRQEMVWVTVTTTN